MATKKSAKKDEPKKLRWAIVGCGGISKSHMKAIERLPEIEVVAGCDILPERLKEFYENYGVKKLYKDWNEMLDEVKPDVVDVCTPNGVHCPAALAALNAGCHVMTEKPMAMTPDECQQMIDAAKKNNRLLGVGFQYRYNPRSELCCRLREAGDLGDILFVKCQALRRHGIPNWGVFGQKALQGGGPLIDIGVHIIEAAHYCMGSPRPVAASGNVWTYFGDRPSSVLMHWPNWDWKNYTVEDLAIGQIRFDNGAIMQVESSFSANIPETDVLNFQIMGTKGGFDWKTGSLYTDHADVMVNSTPAYLPEGDWYDLFAKKLGNFASGCLHGTPLRCPGEAGLAVQKILDGIYRSAAAKKEIEIL